MMTSREMVFDAIQGIIGDWCSLARGIRHRIVLDVRGERTPADDVRRSRQGFPEGTVDGPDI
ncbi:MAG: hypothetical protein MUE97_00840 [Phycisphaerales bacterium]|jgi:ribosomal protein S13|nr:hypothetical protein [Phycisphaerales bacterium]